LFRLSITLLGILSLANAQISIRTNPDGTSSVSLAGEMSVREGTNGIFPDINNTAFSCSILTPVKAFYDRVKGKANRAAENYDRDIHRVASLQ
jgi:hypothetical protein